MFTWNFMKSVLYPVAIALLLAIAYGLIFKRLPSDLVLALLIIPITFVLARIFANIFNDYRSRSANKNRKVKGSDGR
jgi:4-hydroxybenzoate polyprenyltransferase